MMPRYLRLTGCPILLVVLSVCTHAQKPPSAGQEPSALAGVGVAGELECTVMCSRTKLGTAVAELSWRAASEPLDREELEARVAAQGLEVTVYKDGFSKGTYATLSAIERNQKFVRPSAAGAPAPIAALDRLTVADIQPLKDRVTRQYLPAGRSTLVAVQVEGLEPGLNYFWRVPATVDGQRVTSAVVRCQAPTCPVDWQRD